MARDGYRVFDSDTHVGPDAAVLSTYLSPVEKERLAGWAEYESRDRHGKVTYTKGQRHYRRRLGEAKPDEKPAGYMAGFTGVALAGIMGGQNSEINSDTAAVLLESACFKPQNIRATSKKLELRTDSSYRFERGADVGICDWAGRRAALLFCHCYG